MISISRLTLQDAELLSNLGGITLLQSHGHSAPPHIMQAYVDRAFNIEACRQELSDEANIFHAIWQEGRAVGYTKIRYCMPHPAVKLQNVTKMERLYLLNNVFQKGLGQALLQNAVNLSRAAGQEGMWLNVWKENERAIRFYTGQGFVSVGESQFVLTETHSNPNWVMLLTY